LKFRITITLVPLPTGFSAIFQECEDYQWISDDVGVTDFGVDAIGRRMEYISIQPTGV